MATKTKKRGAKKGRKSRKKQPKSMFSPTVIRILQWAVVIGMPFFLGLGILDLAINERFIRWEYAKPNFPIDPYGFTQEERYDLALVSVNFLRSTAPADEVIFMLEEQTFPGTNDPLFIEREIGHMLDVKLVLDRVIRPIKWVGTIAVVAGLGLLLYSAATRPDGYVAIFRGGIATTGVLLAIALFILIGWSVFFVAFHDLLFPPGTWTFAYTDSLIRLYPEKLFFDWGVLVSLSALGAGIFTTLIGYFLKKQV